MFRFNRFSILHTSIGSCALLAIASISPWIVAEETSQEEAYSRAIAARSSAIVEKLGLSDEKIADRIELAISEQYRGLRDIHDSRDAEIKALQANSQEDSSNSDNVIEEVRQDSRIKQFQLHRTFVARLSAELTPEQVIGVKDGMTYGVVPTTYARYLQMLPNLTEDEKLTIMAFLIEAREYAMDAGSSDEKHGWFRKYKGKINNYLSSAGYKF